MNMAIVAMSFQKHWKALPVSERKRLLRKYKYSLWMADTVPSIEEVSASFVLEACGHVTETRVSEQPDTDRE